MNIGGDRVRIEQQTRYPWEGDIKISVDPDQPRDFSVYLRIPGWTGDQVMAGHQYSFLGANRSRIILKVNGRAFRPGDSSGGVEVVDLEQQTPTVGFEWPVVDTGRAASIGVGGKALAILPLFVVSNDEVTGNQVNLLPIFVNKRLGSEHTGLKSQETRTASTFRLFVESTGKNLLLDAFGIARRSGPSLRHVE